MALVPPNRLKTPEGKEFAANCMKLATEFAIAMMKYKKEDQSRDSFMRGWCLAHAPDISIVEAMRRANIGFSMLETSFPVAVDVFTDYIASNPELYEEMENQMRREGKL